MDIICGVVDMGRRFRRSLDGYISFKKFAIIVILILLLLLYMGPSLIPWRRKSYSDNTAYPSTCLSELLNNKLKSQLSKDDIHIQHIPLQDDEKGFIPVTGNGYLWWSPSYSSFDPDLTLYLPGGRGMKVPLPYNPVLDTTIDTPNSKEALLTEYVSGCVLRFECFYMFGQCVTLTHTLLVHRTRISLILQHIHINNPTDRSIDVRISYPEYHTTKWPGASTTQHNLPSSNKLYVLVTGKVRDGDFMYAVAVAKLKLDTQVNVAPRKSERLCQYTAIHHLPLTSWGDEKEYEDRISELTTLVEQDLSVAVTKDVEELKQEHVTVWNKLWLTGYHLSPSLAPGALNGDTINATLYYVMTSMRVPLHEAGVRVGGQGQGEGQAQLAPPPPPTSGEEAERLYKLWKNLFYTENCYQGVPTLQARTLWSNLNSIPEVIRVVALWRLTLTKNGCAKLLEAGSDGVMQAMVLSLGAFKFSDHHLEFNTEPKDLHRDCMFRRISYGNATHVNITVRVRDEDNLAVMQVALDRSDRDYYACDAGCIDEPRHLGRHDTYFPVKVTNPKTAALYISADRQHIDDIRHIIHVQEVNIAPPHEHHILALHRHGHHLGGLPTLFWLSIAALVLVFHLFLFKLIYQEYCVSGGGGGSGGVGGGRPTRYSM